MIIIITCAIVRAWPQNPNIACVIRANNFYLESLTFDRWK